MAFAPIVYKAKALSLHKAMIEPDFSSKTVLVADTWDYVDMWLKRHKCSDALFYWEQAKSFFDASNRLPKTSSPLTAYYCFLNAVKVLLEVKKRSIPPRHGVSGETRGPRASLSNEIVKFQNSGILPELCHYLGEPTNPADYTLGDLLYHLPYIHRAYKLTFGSRPELFVPIRDPFFVRKQGSKEAWFSAEIDDKRYATQHTLTKLGSAFEHDQGVKDKFIIRMKSRFEWQHGNHRKDNLQKLIGYHRKVRKRTYYIYGPMRLWYVKHQVNNTLAERSSLTITFAAMHRLSELARYTPTLLAKHFDAQHNWLLSEFISTAAHQFIDEISAEITGQESMIPGRKSIT